MKVSIFKNGKIAIGIDYSKRKDCENVVEITEEQVEKLKNGCVFENGEIKETKYYLKKYNEKKINTIKQKYNNLILEKYPYYKQINMGADIQEIHLLARQEERAFTQDEMMKVGEGLAMKNWIAEQRVLCEKEIQELENK